MLQYLHYCSFLHIYFLYHYTNQHTLSKTVGYSLFQHLGFQIFRILYKQENQRPLDKTRQIKYSEILYPKNNTNQSWKRSNNVAWRLSLICFCRKHLQGNLINDPSYTESFSVFTFNGSAIRQEAVGKTGECEKLFNKNLSSLIKLTASRLCLE